MERGSAGSPPAVVVMPAPADAWRKVTAIGIAVLAILAVIAAAQVARPILMPIVAGLVVGFILGPLTDRASRLGIPTVLANTALVVAVLGVLYASSILLVPALAEVIREGPAMAASLRDRLGMLERSFATLNDLAKSLQGGEDRTPLVRVDSNDTAWIADVIGRITPAFAELLIFFFTLILFLASRKALRDRIVLAFRDRDSRLATLKIVSGIENRILGYFGTISLINLGLGTATGGAMALLGMPAPLLWAVLAFLLNFLPVVGPLLMKALLLAAGIVFMPTLGTGLGPLAVYLALQIIEANLVTPAIVGKRLTLEPLLVFVGVVFFTWLWGPVGAFLAVPLIIVVLIVRDYFKPADDIPLPDRGELGAQSSR